MQVAGEVTIADLRAFSWFLIDRRRDKRAVPRFFQPLGRIIVFGVVVGITGTVARWLMERAPQDDVTRVLTTALSVLLVLIWALIALFGLLCGLMLGLVPWAMAKQPGVLGHRTIILDNDGFRERTESVEQCVSWQSLREVGATERHFFVFITRSSAFVIPRRFFARPEVAELFIGEIRRRIAQRLPTSNEPVFVAPE